jgi:branched-chain amino acid transport system ATP-binding protein
MTVEMQASGVPAPADGAMTGAKALTVTGLQAFYGPARALAGVDLSIEAGGALGLIGNNGAGKTTLLRSIAGLHRGRKSGKVEYGETSILGKKADFAARLGIGLVRDGGRVFENMTIRDHLNLAARLGKGRDGVGGNVEEVLATFPLLSTRGPNTKAGYLSGGQRQVLCLAMAVVSGATCILLDEPSAGLAESTSEQVFGIIGDLAKSGITLLIAEQDVRWLRALTKRVADLEMGRIINYQEL